MEKVTKEHLYGVALILANKDERLAMLMVENTIMEYNENPEGGFRLCGYYLAKQYQLYVKTGQMISADGKEIRMNTDVYSKSKRTPLLSRVIMLKRKDVFA